MAKQNLCKWHSLVERKIKKYRNLKIDNIERKAFFNNLSIFGYSKLSKEIHKNQKNNLVKAFQRKFRQDLINGKIDRECLLISENLVRF